MHIGQSDIVFNVNSGVRQGCVMSAVSFNQVTDWIMKKTTERPKRKLKFILFSFFEDVDFADDVALLSHTRPDMEEKTNILKEIKIRTKEKKIQSDGAKSEKSGINVSRS